MTIEKRSNGRYRTRVRRDGRDVSKTFSTKEAARKWETKTEQEIDEGTIGYGEQNRTLCEAVERYRRQVLPLKKRSTSVRQDAQLNRILERVGARKKMRSISSADINNLKNFLLEQGKSGATVNRYLALVSSLFREAKDEWKWVSVNPVKRVKRLREKIPACRYLSNDEALRLRNACKKSKSKYLYAIVSLAMFTGMRRSEIEWLRWADIDTVEGIITLRETKNGNPRRIPVDEELLAVFNALDKEKMSSELVFPGRNKRKPVVFWKHWRAALKQAGIREFRFHDLRHTAGTQMARSKINMFVIADVLGHKSIQTTKRYIQTDDEMRREALMSLRLSFS